MLKQLVKTIRHVYSGQVAKRHVAEVAQHHRIQASPGHRAAAQYVLDTLQGEGITAELLQFPAQEGLNYWAQPGFQEWDCRGATLELLQAEGEPQVLCDYRVCKLSLIQRSAATPAVELDVVHVADGTELAHYEGLDVAGKLVLTTSSVDRVHDLAVSRLGAAGIIFYGMRTVTGIREAMDLPDALQYTSFWWYGGEKRCYGFVLSPRAGEQLRQEIERRQRANEPAPRVRAWVDSDFYDGQFDVVSATIPGDTPGTVVVVAHLCHPEPSANDNASGTGAAMEAACALHHLIQQAKLATPKRTIQFLWLPEMTGTYAYLATHEDEIAHMVAGVNLDMVGEDQDQCGSVWIIESPAESTSSFVSDLMAAIRAQLGNDVRNLAGTGSYGLYREAESRFSGGSDHYILSDPTVGVPTPMLIQWPDKYYHTSADTLDRVSERMLAKVGVATAAYAYFCATATARDVLWLAQEMCTRYRGAVARRVQEVIEKVIYCDDATALAGLADHLARKAAYWSDRQREAFLSLLRLDPEAEDLVQSMIAESDQLLQTAVNCADDALTLRVHELGASRVPQQADYEVVDAVTEQAARLVPQRAHPGPAELRGWLRLLAPAQRDAVYGWLKAHDAVSEMMTLAQYWADGSRTIAEIAELVELECDKSDLAFLVRYFELLRDVGLVVLTEAE